MDFPSTALFRFYAELNDLLQPEHRAVAFGHPCDGQSTVKDIIESLGVPHTEVDLILLNGEPVNFASPSGNVVGRHMRIGDHKEAYEVVGIASDGILGDPRTGNAAAVYVAAFQNLDDLEYAQAILRCGTDPGLTTHAIRERVESLGREYPLEVKTIKEEYQDALSPERMLVLLTGFFGGCGVLLAAVGVYGLLSYSVSRRIREIGVRAALGATAGAIARLVLREVAVLVAIGLAAGLAIALAGGRTIAAFLYGVSSHDPAVLVVAAGLLAFVAVLATLLPVTRAIRIDPVTALHYGITSDVCQRQVAQT